MGLLRETNSETTNVSHLLCARENMTEMTRRSCTHPTACLANRIDAATLRMAFDHLGVQPDMNSDAYATLFGGAV